MGLGRRLRCLGKKGCGGGGLGALRKGSRRGFGGRGVGGGWGRKEALGRERTGKGRGGARPET